MRLLLSLAAVAIAKEWITEVKWGQLRSLLTRKSQLTAGLGPKMADKYLKILDFFVYQKLTSKMSEIKFKNVRKFQ